ncbi:aromatic amino acid ammonia-lyase, partial [Agrobacterium sp. SHOUNA12C]|nr:aromatic amino acid ammonia-lyase [Agrobacterium sp. SHOUNA12C]
MTTAGNIVSFTGAAPTVSDIAAIARRNARVTISSDVEDKILAARAIVDRYTASDMPVYGLTTGLGAGVDTRLATDDLVAFQLRVPQARAVGVGAPLPRDVVRAM